MNEETNKQSRSAPVGAMLDHEAAAHVPPDGPPPASPLISDAFAQQLKKLFFSPAALFCLLLLYVLGTRTWNLADKVMHHDESLFAYYGYWLFMGRGYDYQPILHGPVLQFVSAFFFLLFGDDQWTMRLPNLLGGLLMFPVAWHWRRYLGGGAAALIGVTALIALSPSITYYARFLRNDVPYLTATIWCAYCTLRLLHTGRSLYAWGSVMAATLMFCMMESSIFFFAACLGYLTTMILVDNFIWRSPKSGDSRCWPEWLENELYSTSSHPARRKPYRTPTRAKIALLAVPAALGVTFLIGWLYWRMLMETVPLWAPLQLVAGKVGITLSQNAALIIITLIGLTIAYGGAIIAIQSYYSPRGRYGIITWITHALWRNRWHIIAAIAVGVIAYTTLFTTFFTHTRTASFDHNARDFAGPERALTPVQIYKNTWDYWWDQHKLHRIKGPFHYYLPILFLYELPTLTLVFTGWIRAIWSANRRWLLITSLVVSHIILAIIIKVIPPIDWEMMDQKFHLEEHFHLFQVLVFAQLLLVIAPLLFLQGRRVESFLTYWAVTSLFAYSYAGEKVPWLTIHSAAPFALLATAQLVWIWRRLCQSCAESSFNSSTTAVFRHRRPWKIAFVIIAVSGALYQVRTNHLLNFVHPWSPAERLVYNHTSPDLHTAIELIEDLSEKTNFGHQIPIYMNGEMGWPLHWYLRDYTNIMPPYGETADNTTRPIVMVDWHHAATPNIVENYTIRRMKVREWWEPARLDLRAMADLPMIFTQKEARQANFALTQRYQAMKTEWRKLWRYIAYREIWIDPANPGWSNGANEFCFAVRNDIAEQLMSYQWLSATPKRVDVTPYQPH